MREQPLPPYSPIQSYFVPEKTVWPLVGAIGLFTTVFGLVQWLHQQTGCFLLIGGGILLATMIGWFGTVIRESLAGLHSRQLDKTYRLGMLWFIVSEIFLFGVFFAALFYSRLFSVTELGGAATTFAKELWLSRGDSTHQLLWPDFQAIWPLLHPPNTQLFSGPTAVIPAWGIPALNTLILLSSAVTVTWAHWGLIRGKRAQLVQGLICTIALGILFEYFQVTEYFRAYTEMNLKLSSGIYGTTFFTLTGLHAMHVTMGIIMLSVMLIRSLKGHFLPSHHFAFEATAWYWHFVDVVWLFLFVFVYWL